MTIRETKRKKETPAAKKILSLKNRKYTELY